MTRYSGQEDRLRINAVGRYVTGLFAPQGSRTGSLAAEGQVEAGMSGAPAEAQQAMQVQQFAAVPVADQQQSPKEKHAEGSAQKPAALRRALDGPEVPSEAEAAGIARSIDEARKQADALALEAATARAELAAGIEQHRQAVEEERETARRNPERTCDGAARDRGAGRGVAPGRPGSRAAQEGGGKRSG